MDWAAAEVEADFVFYDLGPNLGALNRAALAGADYFITPIAPDLFSLQGTENLGRKLDTWRKEWKQCHDSEHGEIDLPNGTPQYAGYVVQQHNLRNNPDGMTLGWKLYGEQIEPTIRKNIVSLLEPFGQIVSWNDDNYNLGYIPNLHSLIPYSQEARKPVFECTGKDGLKGAHITRAKDSRTYFEGVCSAIRSLGD